MPVDNQAYYDVLGVSKGATDTEIKKAFRKQAMKHHPDRGGDEHKFKELNEAYEVLSDETKKAAYDRHGKEGMERGGGGGGGGGNPFEAFFGGGARGSPQRDTGPKKDAPMVYPLPVSLEQLYVALSAREPLRRIVLSRHRVTHPAPRRAPCAASHRCLPPAAPFAGTSARPSRPP
jgi:DnaJ family protein A protein 2